MTNRDDKTQRDEAAEEATEHRTDTDTNPGTVGSGRPPGSEYEDPATALTPSAGPGAGATGPGGTGRSDMRDIGDAAAGAGRDYGTTDTVSIDAGPEARADIRAGAGGIPEPRGYSTGVDGQVSHTLLDADDEDDEAR